MSEVSIWNKQINGKLSVEILKEQFPSREYRVSSFSYPAGIKFPGSMREAQCYVVSGACTYCFDDLNIELSKGQYAKLLEGSYILKVGLEQDLEVVLVWNLSKLR